MCLLKYWILCHWIAYLFININTETFINLPTYRASLILWLIIVIIVLYLRVTCINYLHRFYWKTVFMFYQVFFIFSWFWGGGISSHDMDSKSLLANISPYTMWFMGPDFFLCENSKPLCKIISIFFMHSVSD